jgi:DNA-directed RNA polymerase subunit H
MAKKFDVTKHILVPKHSKLSERELKELMEKYNLSLKELPKILISDPAIEELSMKEGDVVKVSRNSPTAGATVFYRRVVKG